MPHARRRQAARAAPSIRCNQRAQHQRAAVEDVRLGASAAPSQAQATPKTISSNDSSATSGALSTRAAATATRHGIASWPRRAARAGDVVSAAANGSASGRVTQRRQHRADQHRGNRSAPAPPAALNHGPVDRRGDRDRERDRAAGELPRIDGAASSCAYIQPMPTPATTIAAQVRARQALAEDDAGDQRRQERRDRHRHEHVGDAGHRDRDHEGGEHHAQHSPESQSVAIAARKVAPSAAGPRSQPSSTTSATALKKLRQNVTSKLLAALELPA